jgi:hypothetical protein
VVMILRMDARSDCADRPRVVMGGEPEELMMTAARFNSSGVVVSEGINSDAI